MAIFRPGKPWTRLTLTSPATQAAGAQVIQWDNAVGDGDYTWPGATNGHWVCDIAGLYLVVANVARDSVASASSPSGRILHSGTSVAGIVVPSAATALDMSMSYANQLAVGDTITVQATLHATLTAGFAETRTSLFIARIGPVRYTS